MVKLFRLRGRQHSEAADDASGEPEAELTTILERSTAKSRQRFFGRIGSLLRRGGAVDEAFWEELEELLFAADFGASTTAALIKSLRERALRERVADPAALHALLREALVDLLRSPPPRGRLWDSPTDPPPPPWIILVVGVNGSGKTTSIAKLARAYRNDGASVILAAADTFRAAAIEQLQYWGEQVGVTVIAHGAGADPGAVVYDAISAAQARAIDVVIIDTAGRLQTKRNLMAELGKLRRVIAGQLEGAPHETLLVLDAGTGQNGLSQARLFGEAAPLSGILLAKLDGTSKGGIVFAIADQLGLPVRFVGTGEQVQDIAPFDPEIFVAALFAQDP